MREEEGERREGGEGEEGGGRREGGEVDHVTSHDNERDHSTCFSGTLHQTCD